MDKRIRSLMNHYKQLVKDDDYDWVRWTKYRRRFSQRRANSFFLGIMLDQGQLAERAWACGQYMVENYFKDQNFWVSVVKTRSSTIKKICQKGYKGATSFAPNYNHHQFPINLKAAAEKMISEYDSDPRNIWDIKVNELDLIYDRFKEFRGIGDALAKMAQFILVRNNGVAGGIANRRLMSVKPDVLVRRVLARTELSPTSKLQHCIAVLEELKLPSPTDFDAAAWDIGREYCFKQSPDCEGCPLGVAGVCQYATL